MDHCFQHRRFLLCWYNCRNGLYNSEKNEGHYMIKLVNRGSKNWSVNAGDAIGQGIFLPILLADGDSFENGDTRKGGFGSTDQSAK